MDAPALEQLAAALTQERAALLEHNVPGLISSSQAKRAALQTLEADPPPENDKRLSELIALNRMNGALLTRRRREVDIMLRHLGQPEHSAAYDMRGHCQKLPSRRVLAVA